MGFVFANKWTTLQNGNICKREWDTAHEDAEELPEKYKEHKRIRLPMEEEGY